MSHNINIEHGVTVERHDLQPSHISDAERLLAAIEDGKSPEEDIEILLRHTSERGLVDDRIVADEVAGLGIADHAVETHTIPLLLSEQPVEEMTVALSEIEEARGDEALFYIVDTIERAQQISEAVKSQAELTSEQKHEQMTTVQEMLAEDDTDALSKYLTETRKFSKEALQEIIQLLGKDAFEANTWIQEGERDRQLEIIATELVRKTLSLPAAEQVEYLEMIVGLDNKHFPRSSYIKDVLDQHPEHGPDIKAMLFEKKAYIHVMQNLDALDVDRKTFLDVLYQEGKPDLVLDNAFALMDVIDMEELQEQLYARGMADKIPYHFNLFNKTFDQHRLAETLIKENKLYSIVGNLSIFPDIDRAMIINTCIESGLSFMLNEPELLNALEPAAMEALLREQHEYTIILSHPEIFPDADKDDLVELSFKTGSGYLLLDRFRDKKFGINTERLFDQIVEHNQAYLAYDFAEYFTDEQRVQVVEDVIKDGSAYAVLRYIESNPIVSKNRVIELCILNDVGHQLFYDEEVLENESMDEIADLFLKYGKYSQLLAKSDDIIPRLADGGVKIAEAFSEALRSNKEMTESDFGAIHSYLTGLEDQQYTSEVLRLTNRYMGSEGVTYAGYKIIKSLHSGLAVPVEAAELGVTKKGIKGLEQFGSICRDIAEELMSAEVSDETLEKVIHSEVYAGIMLKLYRVDISEFAANESFTVKSVLEKHHKLYREGKLSPMPAEYTELRTELAVLEERSVGLTKDAVERYQVLKHDIFAAADSLSEAHPFQKHLEKIGIKMMEESERLAMEAETLTNQDIADRAGAFKLRNIEEKQAALSELMAEARAGKYVGKDFVLRSPEAMSHVFGQLEKFDVLHSDLRQIIFAWALRKNPVLLEELKALSENPSVDELATVRSFIEQIVNQETFGSYFSDKKLATRFKKLSSVRSIDEALVRHQQETSSTKTVPLTLTPTRSAAMELSGYVGDACWAGKYESIVEEFPNITALILKRGEKGSNTERLVGSALLIETVDDSGDGVLLLRGINPIENFVNKVRIEDFYQSVTSYCRDIATKRGLRPAVVIDTMSGASGTNRPVIHEYQERMRDKMQQIIVDNATSNFNGYDVSQKSYAL